jgi:hypothetical protein
VKDFVKDLGRWFNDPMTQALLASFGALVVLSGINAAHARASYLERKTEQLERELSYKHDKREHAWPASA